jgi:hypothetical protein
MPGTVGVVGRTGIVALVLAASSVALAGPAARKAKPVKTAWKPSSRYEAPGDADALPAYRYGSLSADDCKAELTARSIPFVEETGRGVVQPVRLTGPLHGVTYRTDEGEQKRATTPYEIADCRLVLALDDFAQILERHDIVEVRHYSIYRPPGKSWPEAKAATQHAGALALDAGRFITKDGAALDVTKHFHGAIGDATCGKSAAPHPATKEATELRSILCEAVGAHLFNIVLTPNFNRPHHNHFHLEVAAGVKWYLVH